MNDKLTNILKYCKHVKERTKAHLATYGRTDNTRTDGAEQMHE